MAKQQNHTQEAGTSSDLFAQLAALQGSVGKLDIAALDARVLWKVVQILATRSASIQLGVTRDGGAWAVQYWDGKFPVKQYYSDTQELNRSLAAIIRVDGGKQIDPEWDAIVREYGW
jgi:hypothetical protein